MGERVHDTQLPGFVQEELDDAGLASDLTETEAMTARCIGCIFRRGGEVNVTAIMGCLGIERTAAAHRLRKLQKIRLIQSQDSPDVHPKNRRPHQTFRPTEEALAAIELMPELSGCQNI